MQINKFGRILNITSIGVKFGGCGINLPTNKNKTIYKNSSKLFFEILYVFPPEELD